MFLYEYSYKNEESIFVRIELKGKLSSKVTLVGTTGLLTHIAHISVKLVLKIYKEVLLIISIRPFLNSSLSELINRGDINVLL